MPAAVRARSRRARTYAATPSLDSVGPIRISAYTWPGCPPLTERSYADVAACTSSITAARVAADSSNRISRRTVQYWAVNPSTLKTRGCRAPGPKVPARPGPSSIPRRTYTQSNIDYVIEVCTDVAAHAADLRGYRITEQPSAPRHFMARFERLGEDGDL